MVKTYSYEKNGDKTISTHFKVKEFASIDGTGKLYSDDVLIDDEIIQILEKLFTNMKAYKIVITSGYRTSQHEKKVGNSSGKGYHVSGQAVDINVWKNASVRYTQKEIALALEDLNWIGGIGLINSNTAVHVDNRGKKYWFNERNANKSIGDSFYTFYGVSKNAELESAIHKLAQKGIIENGDYWIDEKERVKNIALFNNNVNTLIIKTASKI